MSHDRPQYSRYRARLGLEGDGADTPFEVLAHWWPAGDRHLHVVDPLKTDEDGKVVSPLFVSGVRYHAGSDELIERLKPGAPVELRDEPDNPYNPRALLVDVAAGQPLRWVPDWLVEDIHVLRAQDPDLEVVVERCNPDAPAHLQLLCRISAQAG
ncbi:MAG: HIRAN domain-containing protein [Geodermatophilaceae bacterium]